MFYINDILGYTVLQVFFYKHTATVSIFSYCSLSFRVNVTRPVS